MNNHTETRLTDYALGELDDAERREVEQLLETDADARRTVDDTAALAMMLRTATTTGVGNDVAADAALRAKLLEKVKTAAEPIVVATTTIAASRNRRTTVWAVAASIAVLCTSVGTVFVVSSGQFRRGGPIASVQKSTSDVEFERSLQEAMREVVTQPQHPGPAIGPHGLIAEGTRPDLDSDGAVGLDVAGQPIYLNMGTSSSSVDEASELRRDKNSPAPAPSPALPSPDRRHVPVTAQPLANEIPKVQTFNYGTGSTTSNSYSGGTVVNGGTTTYAGTVQPPQGPVIMNPTPELRAFTKDPSVAGQPIHQNLDGAGAIHDPSAGKPSGTGKLKLTGANTYNALGDLATDGRMGREREWEFRDKAGDLQLGERFRIQEGEGNTEGYNPIVENDFLKTTDAPLSTFSIDVDTASYSNVRRFLNGGQLPPPSAVRLEEFINYFTYEYPQPTGDDPFAVTTEAARCPWNGEHVLVRVGLKGKEIHRKERPATNLVFLVDVSGSMNTPNKLPLVRESLKLLVNELGDSDRVAMVVYAGNSGLVLPSTGGDRKQTILEAIDKLDAGGSTNGASGINLAYQVATENFIKGGVNRVVLATDGDFNVGVTNQGDLVTLIEKKAKTGVFFSALGYGMGNLKDSTLEQLSDKGNGNYAYIDTLAEARKVLVEQMSGTLVTIAKDVKIQIEFNPNRVAAYRLLGYENRMLAAQDFNNDKKDAGEIGAGHTVTALYELIPAGKDGAKETAKLPTVDPLKFQQPKEQMELTEAAKAPVLLNLKLRYKQPDGDVSKLIERPLADDVRSYAQASGDFKFASSVAAFGMLLRDSKYRGSATFDAVLELAQEGIGADRGDYRAEFVKLVHSAKTLSPQK